MYWEKVYIKIIKFDNKSYYYFKLYKLNFDIIIIGLLLTVDKSVTFNNIWHCNSVI